MARTTTPTLTVGGAPRVNLMPRGEIERRSLRALLRRWAWGIVAALAVVALAGAGAFWLELSAQQRLAAEQARTQELLSQVAALSPVRAKLELESELADYRSAAMAADLTWSELTERVQAALPEGVSVIGFDLEPGGIPAGEDPAAEVGAFGTFTLLSDTPTEVVTIIRALRPVDDVTAVEGWETNLEEIGYTYLIRIAFDQTVYTGAFAEEDEG